MSKGEIDIYGVEEVITPPLDGVFSDLWDRQDSLCCARNFYENVETVSSLGGRHPV